MSAVALAGRGLSSAPSGAERGEAALVARARTGDRDAFEALVARHADIAVRTAWLASGSAAEAEEAAQDAWLKAWRALDSFQPDRPFRPWLLRIVANEARNRRRAAGRRARLALRAVAAEPPPPESPPERGALDRERRDTLLTALDALADRDRLVLTCRYLLDLSEEETAAALGWRRGTVKSRSSRALGRLRARLGEEAV